MSETINYVAPYLSTGQVCPAYQVEGNCSLVPKEIGRCIYARHANKHIEPEIEMSRQKLIDTCGLRAKAGLDGKIVKKEISAA